eukprot:CAMPEP_0203665818 /NCGR_PEP_ID=MMETSP0090-20130426/2971_1 /ASSEMBLY_ACC=CAM_ASM_001088 /TAXON_ID=426623 /ORGANISM="Chaetoceros affinis, Strain CCMP159" /LENGTH=486 /DNA_ID=CAMNT_0050529507 /DNA_START=56 /DNA_END=1516 /DNA_ORIENTATION=-
MMAFSKQAIKFIGLLHVSSGALAIREVVGASGETTIEGCTLNIVQKSTNSPSLHLLQFNDEQFTASTPTRMISSMTFSDGCTRSDDHVKVNIPTSGAGTKSEIETVRSFDHVMSMDRHSSDDKNLLRSTKNKRRGEDSPLSSFWWYGEDSTDGSTFEYTTDSSGKIVRASFIDMTSRTTTDFLHKDQILNENILKTIEGEAKVISSIRRRRRLADLVEGDTVYCQDEDAGKIYRWVDGELRHYPMGTIAASWEENWRDLIVYTDCSSLPHGAEMPIETMPEEELIRCMDQDYTKVYKWMEGSLRHVPKGRLAELWSMGWRDTIVDLNCGSLSVGDAMTGLFLQSLTVYPPSNRIHFQSDGTKAGVENIRVVKGLQSSSLGPTVSFHSMKYPSMYIRQVGYDIMLQNNTYAPETFAQDVSFVVTDPLGGGFKQDGFVSLESINDPTFYIYANPSGMLQLSSSSDTGFRDDRASFRITSFGDFYPPIE